MPDSDKLNESPSQTAGPYVHIGCSPSMVGIAGVYPRDLGSTMVGEGARGERIVIEGQVFDGDGQVVTDAMIEIWQADAAGLFKCPSEQRGSPDPAFAGWGRQPTDLKTGLFRFETIKPGRVPGPDGRLQAPHILVWIVARGINLGLTTRIYFADEAEANAEDPLLASIADRSRIQTLLAAPDQERYRFDIHLQGDRETIFFDI